MDPELLLVYLHGPRLCVMNTTARGGVVNQNTPVVWLFGQSETMCYHRIISLEHGN